MSEFDDNRPQNENGDPSPQEEPRPAPGHSGEDAGAAPPPRDGKKPKLSRPALIALAVLAVFLLVGALGWFITLSFPKNPVNAPAAPVESEPSGEWNYPSQDAMKTLTVDDFYLPLDGAVRVRCDVPASQNGLSAGFLEEKVTRRWNSPSGRRMKSASSCMWRTAKTSRTPGSKSAITTATTTTKRWWIPTSPRG